MLGLLVVVWSSIGYQEIRKIIGSSTLKRIGAVSETGCNVDRGFWKFRAGHGLLVDLDTLGDENSIVPFL